MPWCPIRALTSELAGAREGGCSRSTVGAALTSKHLKVGVIPIAHRSDRRVSQWLLRKDVEAGTDPACPTRDRVPGSGPGTLRTGNVVPPGAHRENHRGGLWSSCRSPLPTARGGGGVSPRVD